MRFLGFKNIDWLLLLFICVVLGAGLITMKSFVGAETSHFNQQIIWIIISLFFFFVLSFLDFKFLKGSKVVTFIYVALVFILILLLFVGDERKGSVRWFDLGFFSFQPVDFMKLTLIIVLAKFFSKRHVEIKNIKLIFISAIYAGIPFLLVFLQPDFGSAIILFSIWLGIIILAGVSRKHLLLIFSMVVIAFASLWVFVLADYQKNRIKTFLDPLSDIQGTGYNAYQSTIAVGSGQLFGKGVGYGTQSRLQFLPEHETDFIFAAFAEEWGFLGSLALLILYFLIIWRIIRISMYAPTNFEMLFGSGVAIMLMAHVVINVGMNIGLMPITGTNLPFMSYGGSHLLTTFIALGILMGMNRDRRFVHKDDMKNEFLGF